MRAQINLNRLRKTKKLSDLEAQVSSEKRRPKVKLNIDQAPRGIFDYTFDFTFN